MAEMAVALEVVAVGQESATSELSTAAVAHRAAVEADVGRAAICSCGGRFCEGRAAGGGAAGVGGSSVKSIRSDGCELGGEGRAGEETGGGDGGGGGSSARSFRQLWSGRWQCRG